jgi:hypothetical protein
VENFVAYHEGRKESPLNLGNIWNVTRPTFIKLRDSALNNKREIFAKYNDNDQIRQNESRVTRDVKWKVYKSTKVL